MQKTGLHQPRGTGPGRARAAGALRPALPHASASFRHDGTRPTGQPAVCGADIRRRRADRAHHPGTWTPSRRPKQAVPASWSACATITAPTTSTTPPWWPWTRTAGRSWPWWAARTISTPGSAGRSTWPWRRASRFGAQALRVRCGARPGPGRALDGSHHPPGRDPPLRHPRRAGVHTRPITTARSTARCGCARRWPRRSTSRRDHPGAHRPAGPVRAAASPGGRFAGRSRAVRPVLAWAAGKSACST